MSETRIVKRYANRKLYDTERSRYVTLDQIAEMIRSGEDVKIIDNNTKEDLTSVTLAQILFEEEKKQKSFLPLAAMRNIIQSGGESIQQLATQAGERVRSVFRREAGNPGEGGGTNDAGEDASTSSAATTVRELLERSQQALEEWQKRMDERIRHAVESISPLAGLEKEVRTLADRLAELEKKLEERDRG